MDKEKAAVEKAAVEKTAVEAESRDGARRRETSAFLTVVHISIIVTVCFSGTSSVSPTYGKGGG